MVARKPLKKPAAEKAAGDETFDQKVERKRAAARKRKEAERASLDSNVSGRGRLNRRPALFVRPAWELDHHDLHRFDLTHGVTHMVDQIRPRIHPVDQKLVFNALGATVAFYNLSRLIESLQLDDSTDDVRHELEHIRIGFELALQALDKGLLDRGIDLEGKSKGGKNRSTPEWHAECVRLAKTYSDAGTEPHQLTGKLAQRFKRDRKTISAVLKKAGMK